MEAVTDDLAQVGLTTAPMTRFGVKPGSCGTINGQLQFCVAKVLELRFVRVAVRRFPKVSVDEKATPPPKLAE
jgi:hypothetical protein